MIIISQGKGKYEQRIIDIPKEHETESKETKGKIYLENITKVLHSLDLKYQKDAWDEPCCGINNIISKFEFM